MARVTLKNHMRTKAIEDKLDYLDALFESMKNEARLVAWAEWDKADIDISKFGYSAQGVQRLCTVLRTELLRLKRLI